MEINSRNHQFDSADNADINPRRRQLAHAGRQMDRWEAEQLFEEDVRTVLQMFRPNRRERLLGWKEHRTGGTDFRVTVSWSDRAEIAATHGPLVVPKMADVIESLRAGTPIADPKLDALANLTRSAVQNGGLVDDSITNAFLAAGYDNASILDVITAIAQKTISNFTNHFSHNEPDPAFAAHAWSKPAAP